MKDRENNIRENPPIPPQSIAILQLMAASKRPLTARHIAAQLQIRPQAANKSLGPLLYYGFIRGDTLMPGTTKPRFYRCQSYPRAKRLYLKRMEREFDERYGETMRSSYANRLYNQ